MKDPHDETSAKKQQPLCGHGQTVEPRCAPSAQLSELFRLELHVAGLVSNNLFAEPVQNHGIGRLAQHGVVDLCDDLGGDQDGDRYLQGSEAMAEESERPVRAGTSRERDAVDGKEGRQVPGVALLLRDKESERRHVIAIACSSRVLLRVLDEMASFGALAALEFLDRASHSEPLFKRQLRTYVPWNVEERLPVFLEVLEPVSGRSHEGLVTLYCKVLYITVALSSRRTA